MNLTYSEGVSCAATQEHDEIMMFLIYYFNCIYISLYLFPLSGYNLEKVCECNHICT
jgi:hypothetical protein